ncbi:hypothetical protein ONZ45_g9090 [Pleurotus djamor]|nr:hypothetical protein ONZ45_g9090 [Pleurotus djamor]
MSSSEWTPAWQSEPLPISHLTEVVQSRYLAFIEKHLTRQVQVPPDALPLPKKYDGTPTIEAFDTWFCPFIRWLSCYPCEGPGVDRLRLLLMSCFLEGQALTWFNRVVDGFHTLYQWTFNEAIIALYDRFITLKAVHEADELFNATKYNPKSGVRAFHDSLSHRAARLVYPPGEKTVIKRFLGGLPREFIDEILRQAEGPMSELSCAEIVSYASRVEDTLSMTTKQSQSQGRRASQRSS